MPYIGRNHIAGDHTSNFKVLDDISSYTATFNGSLATIISTADNTIRIPEHRFVQGQRVTYSNGGGGNIGGLTNGTAYFVTLDTANTFKLATSLANANNNTNINLSSVGTGSSHTLTAAFDGVNTTFKITHDGGSSANIVNSAQLQIAINNVIQKANLDSSYTEGFLVVDSRKIQFKTAPTADDIFWGNIIANTIDTFDIADLKIDQFSGDGVTTQFTLSRDVPNNQSVMVTLDGVVQHPSDKDTTRAYRILAEKVIEFSSPPPNPCDVQVRHLGFAGASTGDVTGFYGRTGNVVLGASDHITTGDITPRNINASGIVTASSFVGNLTGNVSGNLTVGGVLTYEDVTNVDSIGIITARNDIHVGAGVSAVGVGTFGSLDISGDIDVDGHTNLDNVSVGGAATITALNNAMPFSIVTSKSSGGIGTYLFKNSSGRYDFKFENTYGGNWYTGSTFHTRILWTAPNESATTPEVCSIIPNTALAGAGGALWGLQFNVTDNVTGLKRAYEMKHNQHVFLLNGNVTGLDVNSTLGVGVTSYIYHGYTGGIGDTDTRFGFSQNENIVFDTNGTQRFRIQNNASTFSNNIVASADLDVDGHTNLDNVSIAGVTTITGTLGSSDITITSNQPKLSLTDSSNNPDWSVKNANGNFAINDETAGATRFSINSSNGVEFHMHAVPSADSTYDLGLTGTRFRAAYVDTYYGDGSNLTGITGTTINNNADNRVITGSGTANTLNGESSLTYNGSSLKIGDTSFSNVNTAAENLIIGTESSGSNRGLSIITHSANTGHLFFGDQDNGTMGGFRYQNGADVLQGYSGGSAPFYLKSNALGLHENYPEAHSITIRGASQNDIPSLVIRKHTDGDTNHDEEIGRIKFKSNDNNVDSGNSVSRIELRAVHVNAAGAAKLEFYTVPNFTTNPVKTMTLNQEGRLCIGTDDAVAKLNVVHSSSDTTATGSGTLANCISVSNTNTTNNNFAGIVFGDRTDSQDFIGGIFTQITDHTQNYGNLVFYTNGSGGRTEKLRIAADGKVGMGAQTNPQGQLDIRTTNDDDAIRLVNTATGDNGIQWWNEYGGLTKRVSMDYGEGDANFDIKCFRGDAQDNRPYGNVRIFTGDYSNPNMNFRVTTLGSVHMPNQPSFAASRTGGDVSNAVVVFNSVRFNVGSYYNNTNGRFTAPIAGKYQFSFGGMAYGASADFQPRIRVNGSNYFNNNGSGRGYGTFEPYGFTVLIDLAKDDYVDIYIYSSSNSAKMYMTGSVWNIFSGHLVG